MTEIIRLFTAFTQRVDKDGMHITFTDHQLTLARPAQITPLLIQQARPNHRPYIHPILAPDGRGVLTEDVPPHHPWQHGLYTGLNDVNGVGFWTEGLRGSPHDGSFHPRPLLAPRIEGERVTWSVVTEWRTPADSPLLWEEQQWTFTDRGDHYMLTLDWTLAAALDLTFGRYDYGGLFLRMPYRKEMGGEVVTSEGLRNSAAEGQRARWVAVRMPLADRDEEWAGIAIFDHSSNVRFPAPWRVDHQLGICPSPCIAGAWQLSQGARATWRYGLFIFGGCAEPATIETQWTNFVSQQQGSKL